MNARDDELGRRAAGARVGVSLPHESAHLHVAGTAQYTDDIPEITGTVHLALGLSPVAHGKLLGIDVARLMAEPGVLAVLTAQDIPGVNDCGAIVHDDPILAHETVRYLGQPVFAVVSASRDLARRAAARAKEVLSIEPLPALLTIAQAHAAGEYAVPPMHLQRGDAQAAIARAPHRLTDVLKVGGQEQFYLEGQISYAIPREDDAMQVYCSTQHPSEMQHLVAHALGVHAHRVLVECRRMGGGFGGKESQSAPFACIAAVAAARLRRPVKLRLDRDDDFEITGKRHNFQYRYTVGFDGEGRVLALDAMLAADAGWSLDLTPGVVGRALSHTDNAYWIPHFRAVGYACRTHKQSNTAFRGFGGPQGVVVMEDAIERIAHQLGKDADDIRALNFYTLGQETPYGQAVEEDNLPIVWSEMKRLGEIERRRAEIAAFNKTSPVLKRGLGLFPLKFGISFNIPHMNQAGALVHVYTDGSIRLNHGGTEMGQGLFIKVAQVVAEVFKVDIDRIRPSATSTAEVPNTSPTAASTGSDLNGWAAFLAEIGRAHV